MKIVYNTNEEIVRTVKEGLERTGGYCPCRLERTEENKCMCEEFKNQIKDPEFEGYCHCMLYYKYKQKKLKMDNEGNRIVPSGDSVFCYRYDISNCDQRPLSRFATAPPQWEPMNIVTVEAIAIPHFVSE